MIIRFDLFNVDIPQTQAPPAINTYTLRDSVNTPVFLALINTLFSYKNGRYYFTYSPFLQTLYAYLATAPTVSSGLPLDQDALVYSAGAAPLSDFTNGQYWISFFDSLVVEQLINIDATVQRYDLNGVNPDPDMLMDPDGLWYFSTSNPKNLAYTVATAIGWVPPGDTLNMHEILLTPNDTILFKVRCAFTPSTISPIYYNVNILLWYALTYVNTYTSATSSLPEQPNGLVRLVSFDRIFTNLPPGRTFVGWLLDGTVYNAKQSIYITQNTTVYSVFDPPL